MTHPETLQAIAHGIAHHISAMRPENCRLSPALVIATAPPQGNNEYRFKVTGYQISYIYLITNDTIDNIGSIDITDAIHIYKRSPLAETTLEYNDPNLIDKITTTINQMVHQWHTKDTE